MIAVRIKHDEVHELVSRFGCRVMLNLQPLCVRLINSFHRRNEMKSEMELVSRRILNLHPFLRGLLLLLHENAPNHTDLNLLPRRHRHPAGP